jgi:hypothetical protein
MAENYVKFRRGTPKEFEAITPDSDTLYFIENPSLNTFELYLGSKKITDGVESGGTASPVSLSLNDLTDVVIQNVGDGHVLVYDDISKKWENKSVADVIEDAISNLSTNITITITNSENKTHSKLFPTKRDAENDLINGDILIIKDKIGNDTNKYQHTAYVFYNNEWTAMDGNYDAENVYFNEDFIFTENVGTIIVPEIGNLTVEAKGKNLKEFLSTIFAAEKDPEVELPSAKIELGMSNDAYEVGTNYLPSYEITFNDGNYSYGPDPTGVIATFNVSDGVNASTNPSANFDSFEIKDDTNYKISATVSYTEGAIPKTNLGNNCERAKISSGELSIKSKTISGYRKSFYGALNNKEDYDIRTLNSSTSALRNGSSFTINLISTTKRVVIAYPATLRNLTSVLDKNDSNSNIVSGFGQPTIKQIKGASDKSSAIDYKVYTMDFANEYGTSNVFTVTI